MLKTVLKNTLFLLVVLIGYEVIRRNVGGFAGSYPFAETWTLNKSMVDVEENLKILQQKNPDLFLDKHELKLDNDPTGYWKIVNFYYPERNEIIKVLIRGFENNCKVLLLSFENKNTATIRLMNKDFNWFENRKEIKLFESRILENL
ncbi:hypothetical protein ACFRAE_06110 [Sphingobacterium sp. HJSM2_6]|uniref:hypothetical protein n=1 Tax=Sphingobacterium sp. HJSM2_6 TaxID=3366264 RepID=UPI003BE804DE